MEAEVTSNCTARNADMVAALGASRAIDYGQQDFTQLNRAGFAGGSNS